MSLYVEILYHGLWSGIAAVGFGVLFNVPPRTILTIALLGLMTGIIKFGFLHYSSAIVPATFVAAGFIGVISVPLGKRIHTPPLVFSVPAVIPMIPGYFAYKMMLALMGATISEHAEIHPETVVTIVDNGLKMLFILVAITLGVSIPKLIFRKESVSTRP